MEYLYDYGLFLAQAATLVAAILIVVGGIIAMNQRQKSDPEGHIEIKHLNEKYEHIKESIEHVVTDDEALKAQVKEKKKADKKEARESKKKRKAAQKDPAHSGAIDTKSRLYVLNFDGDIKASAAENLREEISAVLPQAREGDVAMGREHEVGVDFVRDDHQVV